MNLQLLENPDGSRSDGGARDFSAKAKEEREFVAAAKDGDSAAFKIFPTQSANMVFNIEDPSEVGYFCNPKQKDNRKK
jgi:hypothetical protein